MVPAVLHPTAMHIANQHDPRPMLFIVTQVIELSRAALVRTGRAINVPVDDHQLARVVADGGRLRRAACPGTPSRTVPERPAYVHVGAGVDVPLAGRLHLAQEVRVHLAAIAIIVRPAVGVVLDF